VIPGDNFEAGLWNGNRKLESNLEADLILFAACGSKTWNQVPFLE
jgi:hypothetical protein